MIAAAVPAEVRELAGEQVEGDNAVPLTWKPPLANDKVDESVVDYEVVADVYSYSIVEASACTGRRLNTSCSSLQSALSYPDTHSFRVGGVRRLAPGDFRPKPRLHQPAPRTLRPTSRHCYVLRQLAEIRQPGERRSAT